MATSSPQDILKNVETIRASGLFDESVYRLSAMAIGKELLPPGIDLIRHYLIIGENKGYRPSLLFDPAYYFATYPDVRASMSALVHYIRHGRAEGRVPMQASADPKFPKEGLDPDRETILLLVHDASRTGAPIIGWNLARTLNRDFNVVVVLLNGGELLENFAGIPNVVVVDPGAKHIAWDYAAGSEMARALVRHYKPKFAIVNSTAARFPLPELARALVPSIVLVHEFPRGFSVGERVDVAYHWAAEVVFASRMQREWTQQERFICTARQCTVLPQGRCEVPRRQLSPEDEARRSRDIATRVRPEAAADSFVVVGMGFIEVRKGVEFFLAAAAHVRRIAPDLKVRFCWVGGGFKPDSDIYCGMLAEQVRRSGLSDVVEFVPAVEDTGPVYDAADMLFLSSRLDPMPNVAIDAAFAGVPILCFADAGGIADLLAADAELSELVVPYADDWGAAQAIVRMANDPGRGKTLAGAMKPFAAAHFDFAEYTQQLIARGEAHARRFAAVSTDTETLFASPAFDERFYAPPDEPGMPRDEAIRHYLVQSAILTGQPPRYLSAALRRPFPGFHPIVHAEAKRRESEAPLRDPLVDYIADGFPDGPWKHDVLRADAPIPTAGTNQPRIAVHGHFHYIDLLPDFLERLAANKLRCDLFVSVTSAAASHEAAELLAGYDRGSAEVLLVANRGRNFAPLLTAIRDRLRTYDLIGHLHGKRSDSETHGGAAVGARWRDFLWQNLLGSAETRMADRVVAAFMADPRLGLVFPEDPNLMTWGRNYDVARELAPRLGLAGDLPDNLDFPLGMMFWARPAAFEPFFALNLGWYDYPDEPLPYDGTFLHALERLTALVAVDRGFRYATTYVPGLTR